MVMSSSLEYRICAPVTRYSASGLWEETISAIGDILYEEFCRWE